MLSSASSWAEESGGRGFCDHGPYPATEQESACSGTAPLPEAGLFPRLTGIPGEFMFLHHAERPTVQAYSY